MLTMPVIMMSGHGTIDTAVEATKFGAMAFLEKPITLQKLLRGGGAGPGQARDSSFPAPLPIVAEPIGGYVSHSGAGHSLSSGSESGLTVEAAMTGGVDAADARR